MTPGAAVGAESGGPRSLGVLLSHPDAAVPFICFTLLPHYGADFQNNPK